MMTVWKFTLEVHDGDSFALDMPGGAELLHVDSPPGQPEIVNVWARLDNDVPEVVRRLGVTGTGNPAPARWAPLQVEHVHAFEVAEHVGSVVTDSGAVWHVWDFGE